MTGASATRWQRVRAVFDEAADQPPERWDEIVTRESADDATLRDEVLRLLNAGQEDRFDFEQPRFALGDRVEGRERIGQTIARYQLVRLLGSGGMGAVYEGVRADGEYEQRVAIKLIRPQLGVAGMASRFRHERQILAALEHPNIARLLDGGATSAGEPFFVMEYVEGTPITMYCDEHHLSIHGRLQLFLQACAAVQHAHAQLIVHRDLKPANILVAADGTVKLLDFGVAKLLGSQHDDPTPVTQVGCRPLTPEYASPEQLRDEPATVGGDVYSLGVVLFELVAGRRPFEIVGRSPSAALRALENDPPKPSAAATENAAASAGEPGIARLRRRLSGELDNIVGKALRADATRRYVSAEQLADDVRRFLDGRTVSAQPDSAGYRLRKFVRRHRSGVTAAALGVIVLLGGVFATTRQARRAERERAKAARMHVFLQDMLSAPDIRWFKASQHSGAQVTVSEVLDDAAKRAGVDLASEPDVEAAVRRTLGRTYSVMSRYDEATEQLTRGLALDRQLGAPPVPDLVEDLRDLGIVQLGRGEAHAADTLFRAALALCRTNGERADTAHICGHVLNHLGLALWSEDDLAGAERLFRQTLGIARAAFGPNHAANAIVLGEIAGVRASMGDLAGSEKLYRESLEVFARAGKREFPERASSLGGLAMTLGIEGRFPEAEALLQEEVRVIDQTMGPTHPDAGINWVHLGSVHRRMGKLELARDETARGLALLDGRLAPREQYVTKIRTYEALLLLASGQGARAESLLTQALSSAESKWKHGDPRVADVQDALGQVLMALGRASEATTPLEESVATYERRFGATHPQTIEAQRHLADARAQVAKRQANR